MSQALKVGIFTLLALVAIGYFVLQIEDFNPFATEGQEVVALFDSVAGLDDKAAVRVAGVRVGRVDGIGLDGRRARVRVRLEQPLELTVGTRARVANMGLLGDKYVELVPGPEGAPPLAPGAVLEGETPVSFDDAMAKIEDIGSSIQRVTDSLAGTGEGGESALARLLDNLDATTLEIRGLVADNRAQVGATVANFEQVSATLARELPLLTAKAQTLVDQLTSVVGENRDELAGSLENIEELTSTLQTSARNLNEISGRLARGEGTLGKLLVSDEAHDELVGTLDSIQGGVATLSDTLGRVQKLRLDLDFEGAWLQDREESLAGFGMTLDPNREGDPRLYRVGLSSTPQGAVRTKTQRVTVTGPDGEPQTTITENLTREDDTVISALLGLRMQSGARVWGGLIEDEFGVQVEYPFFDRKLWIDAKAFDFDRPDDRNPHLRIGGKYYFHPNLYLWGGYDDPLESDYDSFFLGGGMTWSDENLKYLLGSVPSGGF